MTLLHPDISTCRAPSRVCTIPFSKPAVSPTTEDEHLVFDVLEDAVEDHAFSAAVGWTTPLRSKLLDKEEVRRVRALLAGAFFKGDLHTTGLC